MELQIRHLSKTYANGVVALDDISLAIPPGMFGLLGPNGAGKSTLMRTLATLQECDSGSVFFGDYDVLDDKDDIRRMLGYLPQDFGLYPKLASSFLSTKRAQILQRHAVISTRLLSGRTLIHVYSDMDPGDGFEEAIGDLEDLYFATIARRHRVDPGCGEE